MSVPDHDPDYSLVVPPVGNYPAGTLVGVGGGLFMQAYLPFTVDEDAHGRYIKLTSSAVNPGALSQADYDNMPVLPPARSVTIRLRAAALITAGMSQNTTHFVANVQHRPTTESLVGISTSINLDRNATFNQWNYRMLHGLGTDPQVIQANSNTRFLEVVYHLTPEKVTISRDIPLDGGTTPIPFTLDLSASGLLGAVPTSLQARHPQYVVYAFDIWNDLIDDAAGGMWSVRQRQNPSGNAGGWPLRQRQNAGATGAYPLRQRQNGM